MKRYKLEITVDGKRLSVKSENDGFEPFAVIGMLDWKKRDIENQMLGNIKPEVVSRKLIDSELLESEVK